MGASSVTPIVTVITIMSVTRLVLTFIGTCIRFNISWIWWNGWNVIEMSKGVEGTM